MSYEIESSVIFPDVKHVKTPKFVDNRGWFRQACTPELEGALGIKFVQDNQSLSRGGVFRGLHYQLPPHGMGKYVTVLRGKIIDFYADLNTGQYGSVILSECENGVYVPPGYAHGFLALSDDTLVNYKCTAEFSPEADRGVWYKDPEIRSASTGVALDAEIGHLLAENHYPFTVSDKDMRAPTLAQAQKEFFA